MFLLRPSPPVYSRQLLKKKIRRRAFRMENFMITPRFPGASLLETVLASLLFLLVFAIGMDTLTRLASVRLSAHICTEADRQLEQCVLECRKGTFPQGTRIRTYSWGEIKIRILPYRDFPLLNEIRITLRLLYRPSGAFTENSAYTEKITETAGLDPLAEDQANIRIPGGSRAAPPVYRYALQRKLLVLPAYPRDIPPLYRTDFSMK